MRLANFLIESWFSAVRFGESSGGYNASLKIMLTSECRMTAANPPATDFKAGRLSEPSLTTSRASLVAFHVDIFHPIPVSGRGLEIAEIVCSGAVVLRPTVICGSEGGVAWVTCCLEDSDVRDADGAGLIPDNSAPECSRGGDPRAPFLG